MGEEPGGKWRWEDAHELFDPEFVDSAAIREGDWREREQAGARQRKDAAKAVRRQRRRRYRLPAFLLLLVAIGLVTASALGKGPTTWFASSASTTSASPGTALPTVATTAASNVPPGSTLAGSGVGAPDEERAELVLPSDARGDCFTVTPKEGDTRRYGTKVDCAEPHQMEFAENVNIADQVNHYLSTPEWDALMEVVCTPRAEALIGGPLDPYGRYSWHGMYPSPRGWQEGDRWLRCGVAGRKPTDAAPEDDTALYSGKATVANQFIVTPAGTCESPDTGQTIHTVDCAAPHITERVGSTDLSGRLETAPGESDADGWNKVAGRACTDVAASYLARALRADERAGVVPIPATSFRAGRRVVECEIAVYSSAGAVMPVSGSRRTS